jgi:ectoine hydroxylase-related dioxygenase (phytanoyl-CoA dioxygenase family)
MVAIARRFLGETAIPYKATLFDKSPTRNRLVAWHQDTALPVRERREIPEWGPWSIKAGVTYALAPASALAQVVALRLHMDDSRADNGPLRVLPGTHTLGLLTESDIARLTTEVPAVDCTVPAGGVVAMRPLIIHASSKAESNLPRLARLSEEELVDLNRRIVERLRLIRAARQLVNLARFSVGMRVEFTTDDEQRRPG